MTRSPAKGRPPRLTLADLAPQQRITCMMCGKDKPAQGSRRFRAHDVCAECVQRLDGLAAHKSTHALRGNERKV